MDYQLERRCVVGSEHDLAAASKAALMIARHAGLSVMRQYCVAGLVAELGQGVLRRSGRAVVVVRDESDETAAMIRVSLRERGPGDGATLPGPGAADSWTARWPGELAFEPATDGRGLSVALRQPRLAQ